MIIHFDGTHDNKEVEEGLASMLQIFKERYQICRYREIHLNFTLVDEQGFDLELVNEATQEPLTQFNICTSDRVEVLASKPSATNLRLVVDNTRSKKALKR